MHRSSGNPAVAFVLSAIWIALSIGFSGALLRFLPGNTDWLGPLLTASLLFGGFYLIAVRLIPERRPLSSAGFVRRPSAGAELALGVALGWGSAIALVLPGLLSRHLQLTFQTGPDAWRQTFTALFSILCTALAAQLILSGLAFRLLLETIRPAAAVLAVMLLAMLWSSRMLPGQRFAAVVCALATLISCVAWLRTRAIWLPLGMQAAFSVVLGLLFGLPLFGGEQIAFGLVRGTVGGPLWLTGQGSGPLGSLIADAFAAAGADRRRSHNPRLRLALYV